MASDLQKIPIRTNIDQTTYNRVSDIRKKVPSLKDSDILRIALQYFLDFIQDKSTTDTIHSIIKQ